MRAALRRVNLFTLELAGQRAHDGVGLVDVRRITDQSGIDGACDFIDFVEMPPGTSIGDHRHADDEEEFYLVLDGTGVMRLEEDTFDVRSGDLVRNAPGGRHGLVNTGVERLRLFVFQLRLHPGSVR